MSYKVFWTERAEKDIAKIEYYLLQRWNTAVVLSFFDKVDHLLELISETPELFPEISKKKKIRKCVIVKQITLYYKVIEAKKQIDLIAFWDNRQDPERLNL